MRYLKTKSQMDQFLVVEEPHPVTKMRVNKLHTCGSGRRTERGSKK